MSGSGILGGGGNINIVAPQGPLVSVLHTERQMRIFGVTENELRTLTIVNAAVAFLFSLGTGCFGYLLNLDAAAAMTEKIPKETEALLKLVQPGLLSLGVAFYVAGAFAWIMRSGFINTIKRESDPQMRQAGRATGRLNRILEAVRS